MECTIGYQQYRRINCLGKHKWGKGGIKTEICDFQFMCKQKSGGAYGFICFHWSLFYCLCLSFNIVTFIVVCGFMFYVCLNVLCFYCLQFFLLLCVCSFLTKHTYIHICIYRFCWFCSCPAHLLVLTFNVSFLYIYICLFVCTCLFSSRQ